ncbi:hypothetical protein AAVH_22919 [Aphelenchoides avenae]|nr:hypothetical protein AAVH_22919 [Aphelenchus avenae]
MATAMPEWTPAKLPTFGVLEGRYVRLEPLDPSKHGDSLWEALEGPGSDPSVYDFIYYGPFADRHVFDEWLAKKALGCNPNSYLTYRYSNVQVG